jgi:hypothetical protein
MSFNLACYFSLFAVIVLVLVSLVGAVSVICNVVDYVELLFLRRIIFETAEVETPD